jgi:hypothetical protein
MPESFEVEVCYERPCHWTPPQNPPSATVRLEQPPHLNDPVAQTQENNIARTGNYGEHRSTDLRKRAPEPDPQRDTRQGPPLPEPPHKENGDPINDVPEHNAMSDIDPEVQKLAIDRQEATKTSQKAQRPPSFINGMDRRYILRPEAIESVFYMWRITGDPVWQDKGWKMWESIESATWTNLAYSAIRDVNDKRGNKADSMERYSISLLR